MDLDFLSPHPNPLYSPTIHRQQLISSVLSSFLFFPVLFLLWSVFPHGSEFCSFKGLCLFLMPWRLLGAKATDVSKRMQNWEHKQESNGRVGWGEKKKPKKSQDKYWNQNGKGQK